MYMDVVLAISMSMSTARFGTRGVLGHCLSGIGDCWLVRDFGIYVQRGGAASERGRVRGAQMAPQVVTLAEFRDLCVYFVCNVEGRLWNAAGPEPRDTHGRISRKREHFRK